MTPTVNIDSVVLDVFPWKIKKQHFCQVINYIYSRLQVDTEYQHRTKPDKALHADRKAPALNLT